MMRVQRLLSRRIICHRSPLFSPVDFASAQHGAVAYVSTGQLRRRDRETGVRNREPPTGFAKPVIRTVEAGGREPRNDDFPSSRSFKPVMRSVEAGGKEPRNDDLPSSISHRPWLARPLSNDPRAEDGPSREIHREQATVWRPFTTGLSSIEQPFITDDANVKTMTKFKFNNFKLRGAPRPPKGLRKLKPRFWSGPKESFENAQTPGSPYGAIWESKPRNKKDRKKWAASWIARARARKEAASNMPPIDMAVLSREARLDTYKPLEPEQTQRSKTYFDRADANRIWRTKRYKDVPPTTWPEVAFVGFANAGKSSLINFVCVSVKMIARVSHKPGHTDTLVGHAIGGRLPPPVKGHSKLNIGRWERYLSGPQQIMMVDIPGYGVPESAEIGDELMKYLTLRKQVRKIYVCVDALDGIRDDDIKLILHLRKNNRPYQIVLTKVDQLLPDSGGKNKDNLLWLETLSDADKAALQEARWKALHRLNSAAHKQGLKSNVPEDILCSCGVHSQETRQRGKQRTVGLGDVRWSIMQACGITAEPAKKTEHSEQSKEEESLKKD